MRCPLRRRCLIRFGEGTLRPLWIGDVCPWRRQLRVDYGCSTGRQNPEEAVTAAMLTPGPPWADDLLRACAARLYPSAVRMTGTAPDAEDWCKRRSRRRFAASAQFQPGTNLNAWLHRIMTNIYISGYRTGQRQAAPAAAGFRGCSPLADHDPGNQPGSLKVPRIRVIRLPPRCPQLIALLT
jgi:hypothetical protein